MGVLRRQEVAIGLINIVINMENGLAILSPELLAFLVNVLLHHLNLPSFHLDSSQHTPSIEEASYDGLDFDYVRLVRLLKGNTNYIVSPVLINV